MFKIHSSLVLSVLLIGVTGRFLSEPKDGEVSASKFEDGEEDFDGIGGIFGETPKLGTFPEKQEFIEAIDEQKLLSTQQEKPKLQPNDESSVIVIDGDQPVEDTHEDFEPNQTQKTFETPRDCIPRYMIEDKGSEELAAKEVVEDSLSPVETHIETSTFSKVTDPNMIEEPFKKVYVRPLCDD